MLQIIFGLIIIVIALSIVMAVISFFLKLMKNLVSLSLKVFENTLIVIFLAIGGVPYFAGLGIESICRKLQIRMAVSIIMAIFSVLFLSTLTFKGIYNTYFNFNLIKYIFPAFLFCLPPIFHIQRMQAQKLSEPLLVFNERVSFYYVFFYTTFFLLIFSIFAPDITNSLSMDIETGWALSWLYWGFVTTALLVLTGHEKSCTSMLLFIHNELSKKQKINTTEFLKQLKKDYLIDDQVIDDFFNGVALKFINSDLTEEIELKGNIWFFHKDWYQRKQNRIQSSINQTLRNTDEDLDKKISEHLDLPAAEIIDYRERHLSFGENYNFVDGSYFLSYNNISRIKCCASCGFTIENPSQNSEHNGEWYCSDLCQETEEVCLTIKNKPTEEFFSEAASLGFIVMEGAKAWSQNQKMFAMGSTSGHGFTAEQGNTIIDKLHLRDAEVVGGNNLKNGADRIVDRKNIQTKYCATGRRSVNSCFDGQNGDYKYIDKKGNLMQLEVPKDQYEKAIETMENKIKEGRVKDKGVVVTDPDKAKSIIRKGNLTYKQAQNITKFGTFESISYDIAEGTIVGLTAGGISFGISALIFYIKTKDSKTALRIGVIQGGKTFGKTLTVYVAAQQLHRVAAVQTILKNVNVSSPTTVKLLEKGMGVSSKNAVNNALKGTIVTSVAIIIVTIGPDLIKLIRGRISKAQFFKTLAVATSSVIGGTAGSIAGGIVFSPLGPVGAMAGRMVGGILGGMAFAAIANKISNSLMEEDRVKMLRIIQNQMEYLAKTFLLLEDEIDNLNVNLDKVIQPESLEILFAADNKISVANSFIKPIVIGVIKQRPVFNYSADDIVDVCEEMAA